MKTRSAGSKFEQYSSVCVGKQDFWFFRLDAVNTKLVQENSVVKVGFRSICLKFGRSKQGRLRNTRIFKNLFFRYNFFINGVCLTNFRILGLSAYWWSDPIHFLKIA